MATTINANNTDGVVITPDTSGELELQANGVTKAKVTANGLQDANGNSLRGGSFRNLIINGDMRIAQRGTSATGITTEGYKTVDRFLTSINTLGTWTQSQDTDVPTGQGFSNSIKMQCTTADASPAANDYLSIIHRIEAQNLQHLSYGTSNAKTMTLSFWVKSNKTGTYNIMCLQYDNSLEMLTQAYTINTADTWEKKTLTIVGDVDGIINNDNGPGLGVFFYLAAGSNRTSGSNHTEWSSYVTANEAPNQVNLADSTSNYINITGVQLEVGEGASDFEFLPYDVQLARCQRYYQANSDATGIVRMFPAHLSVGNRDGVVSFVTSMRTAPTVTSVNSTGGGGAYWITTDGFNVFSASVSSITLVQLQSFTASAEL